MANFTTFNYSAGYSAAPQLCSHAACIAGRSSSSAGAGVALINRYNFNDGKTPSVLSICLVEERYGQRAGEFSFPFGKLDKGETCYVSCALRELKEEAKLSWKAAKFDGFIVLPGKCGVLFIANAKGVSTGKINAKITSDNNNSSLPYSMKETTKAQWFKLSNLKPTKAGDSDAKKSGFVTRFIADLQNYDTSGF